MIASVYAVIMHTRAPASRAARIARVWVMEMRTGEKITAASVMARATEGGGSWPSWSRTGMTETVTAAPASRAAPATASA